MKRVYFILIILIAFLETTAQDKVDFLRTKVDGNRNIVDARLRLSHSLNIPRGASWSLNGAKDSIGYVMFNTTLQRFGVYHGSGVWKAYATIDEIELLLDGKVDTIHGKGLSTEDYTSAEKSKLAGIAAGAEVNVNADWSAVSGDAMILNKPTFVATESDPVFLAQKGVANGVASLNSSGKVPNAQIPALALVDTYVVGSQAAMLALSTAEQGDVAIRTDLSKTFILTDNNYSTLASWKELLSPVIPAETDPIWGASPSAGITSTNITNWNTAYSYSQVGHLPLSGGTLTGPLNGTNAAFSGFLGVGGVSSPIYSEQLGIAGTTPKLTFGSTDGYRWSQRIIPTSGIWALRYEEGSIDAFSLNRNGYAAFSVFLGVGGVSAPFYSEQFSISGSTPKMTLGSSDGYRWSSRIIPTSGELAFRYEEGALDALVIDRIGVVSVPSLKIPTGANTGYVLTSDSDGDASWQSPTSGMTYKGSWDASTNTPTLADGTGTTGDTYSVSVGGTQFGRTFVAGGQAIYNGTIWQNIGTSSAVTSVNTYTGAVTLNKSDIGLSNVDNTSDLNKPVSTATQTALNLKANIASPTFTGTVTVPSGSALEMGGQLISTSQYIGKNAGASGFIIQPNGSTDGIRISNYANNIDFLTIASGGAASFNSTGNFAGNLTASNLSGTNTGDQTTITGNAGTATALQTARTISGTSFDGTANITLNNTGITNGMGYISGINSSMVTTALGYTPANSTYTTSGVSTPSISGITNVSSSTAYDQHYIRVGNEVTVKGKFLLSPTANGLTVVRISFPTSPDPTDGTDSAVGSASGIGIAHGNINMHVGSSSAELSMNATTTISNEVYYQFTYTAL